LSRLYSLWTFPAPYVVRTPAVSHDQSDHFRTKTKIRYVHPKHDTYCPAHRPPLECST
jgi:hypothetical protein